MRQTLKNSPLLNETSQHKKMRIYKNRQFAKKRYYVKHPIQLDSDIIVFEEKPSTKQERAHIQKLKNRQAAQKSRQQKKQYIRALKCQIETLKNDIEQQKYCSNCRKVLTNQKTLMASNSQDYSEIFFQSSTFGSSGHRMNQLESPIQIPLENSLAIQQANFNTSQDVQQFRRARNAKSFDSWLQMLCIIGVMLGVFMCYTNISGGATSIDRRDLMQFHQDQGYSLPQEVSNFNEVPIYQQNYRTSYSTVKDPNYLLEQNSQNGLLTLDQLQQPVPKEVIQKIKGIFASIKNRTHHQPHLRAVAKKYEDERNSILSQKLRLYTTPNNGENMIFKYLFDIFVVGDQIQHFFGGQSLQSSGNIQSNIGIYKITAEVHSITKLTDANLHSVF